MEFSPYTKYKNQSFIFVKITNKLYQRIPLSSHSRCKYIPTCSNYAIVAYERFGFIKGSLLSIKRIFKCNPFSKGGIDLVPEKAYKNYRKLTR